jgi:hypothetical protein
MHQWHIDLILEYILSLLRTVEKSDRYVVQPSEIASALGLLFYTECHKATERYYLTSIIAMYRFANTPIVLLYVRIFIKFDYTI